MFDSDQEDMVILYKFPKGLHCKALVDLPFSKTPDVDLDLDCESFVQPLYYYFSFVYYSNPAFLFVLEVMGKFDYRFIKKAQAEKVERAKAEKA